MRAGTVAAAAVNVWGAHASAADFFASLRPPNPDADRAAWLALCPAARYLDAD